VKTFIVEPGTPVLPYLPLEDRARTPRAAEPEGSR
jgi:hypothetical protein